MTLQKMNLMHQTDFFTTLEPVHQTNQESNLALLYNNFEI